MRRKERNPSFAPPVFICSLFNDAVHRLQTHVFVFFHLFSKVKEANIKIYILVDEMIKSNFSLSQCNQNRVGSSDSISVLLPFPVGEVSLLQSKALCTTDPVLSYHLSHHHPLFLSNYRNGQRTCLLRPGTWPAPGSSLCSFPCVQRSLTRQGKHMVALLLPCPMQAEAASSNNRVPAVSLLWLQS